MKIECHRCGRGRQKKRLLHLPSAASSASSLVPSHSGCFLEEEGLSPSSPPPSPSPVSIASAATGASGGLSPPSVCPELGAPPAGISSATCRSSEVRRLSRYSLLLALSRSARGWFVGGGSVLLLRFLGGEWEEWRGEKKEKETEVRVSERKKEKLEVHGRGEKRKEEEKVFLTGTRSLFPPEA